MNNTSNSNSLEVIYKRGQKSPLVTVIIPAYNAEAFVLEAIYSILDQKYNPLEILLINDGSEDSTAKLVERNIPEVRIITQSNAGVAAARNTGLHEAKGELICFLDADDGWYPGKLAAQVNYLLENPDVGVVYHSWYVWKPDEKGVYNAPQLTKDCLPGEIDPLRSGWIYPQLLLDCLLHTSTVMMRRQVVLDIGFFDAALATGEDYDYWLRISRKYQIHKLLATFSFYRATPGSLTSKPKAVNNEYLITRRAVENWGLLSPEGSGINESAINQRFGDMAFDFAYSHYHTGSQELARTSFIQTLKHQPLRFRAMAYLLATILAIRFSK